MNVGFVVVFSSYPEWEELMDTIVMSACSLEMMEVSMSLSFFLEVSRSEYVSGA